MRDDEGMKANRESKVVQRLMPNASAAEKAEATSRWFRFLEALIRIARRQAAQERDSRESTDDDRFENIEKKL